MATKDDVENLAYKICFLMQNGWNRVSDTDRDVQNIKKEFKYFGNSFYWVKENMSQTKVVWSRKNDEKQTCGINIFTTEEAYEMERKLQVCDR